MGWYTFWFQRALQGARKRRDRYGIEPPRPVALLLRRDAGKIGLPGSIRLAAYALLGSPVQAARRIWRTVSGSMLLVRLTA